MVDTDLIDVLYRRVYRERVAGTNRLRLINMSRLAGAREHGDRVAVDIETLATGEMITLDADVLICATGYQPVDPFMLLGDIADRCDRDDFGRALVERDYRIRTDGSMTAGIYLQGGTEHTHGITASLLSTAAVRSGDILTSIAARSRAESSVPARTSLKVWEASLIAGLLPPTVVAAETFGDDPHEPPFPGEEDLIAGAVEGRRREFVTARRCARQALAALDHPATAIRTGPRREPVWPSDVVGSITHCAGYCAAAVARRDDVASLGIDAEPHAPLPPGVVGEVTCADERDLLARLAGSAPGVHWERVLFSAKESVYKAWFPLTGRWLGFDDARLSIDPVESSFRAAILIDGARLDGGPRLTRLIGRFLLDRGLVRLRCTCPVHQAPDAPGGAVQCRHGSGCDLGRTRVRGGARGARRRRGGGRAGRAAGPGPCGGHRVGARGGAAGGGVAADHRRAAVVVGDGRLRRGDAGRRRGHVGAADRARIRPGWPVLVPIAVGAVPVGVGIVAAGTIPLSEVAVRADRRDRDRRRDDRDVAGRAPRARRAARPARRVRGGAGARVP